MDERSHYRRRWDSFSWEQKVGFVLLFGIGIFGAIFGASSFSANLKRPFDIQLAQYAMAPEYVSIDEQESREVARQKTSDTDEDGLVDYDELYVFKTSPYLADSDSDNIDDKAEVFGGQDPNCPVGKECGNTYVVSSTATAAAQSQQTFASMAQALNVDPTRFEGLTFESEDDIREFFTRLSTDEIRQMLLAQGIPQETIDQLTDDDIQELFSESIDEAMNTGQLNDLLEQAEQASP